MSNLINIGMTLWKNYSLLCWYNPYTTTLMNGAETVNLMKEWT